MSKPELLAPAGDMNCLKAADRFGADAVYIGGPLLQLRAEKSAFTEEEIAEAADFLHSKGKKLYVTVNSFMKNNEIDSLKSYARALKDLNIDACIVADLGAVRTIRQAAPDLEVHISTQANSCNYASALAYYEMGAKRIVVAREMTIDEIGEMHAKLPEDLEIEAFVHGAMCMAYSGRCLISSYMNGRSGNRGECTQPCRWDYYLVERNRPNEFFKVEGYEDHTALLSSHDMKAIGFLDKLEEAGVDSFKIEGRMKTEYYVSHVVNAYRRAIDKSATLEVLEDELNAISHRPYNSGFYFGNLVHDHKNDGQYHWDCTFAGTALEDAKDGKLKIQQRNFFKKGDTIEVLSPDSIGIKFTADSIVNEKGEECESACHPQEILTISCDAPVKQGDILRVRTEKTPIVTDI
ncbi:MAG: U32 family peptidase [Acutalibacteraceae bacterium]